MSWDHRQDTSDSVLLLIHSKGLEQEVSLRAGLSPHQLTLSSESYSSPQTQKEQNILVTEDSVKPTAPPPKVTGIPSKVTVCGKGPLT